jgi:hypothetical protein
MDEGLSCERVPPEGIRFCVGPAGIGRQDAGSRRFTTGIARTS